MDQNKRLKKKEGICLGDQYTTKHRKINTFATYNDFFLQFCAGFWKWTRGCQTVCAYLIPASFEPMKQFGYHLRFRMSYACTKYIFFSRL